MKMGISVWAFPESWDLKTIFIAAKKAGFDGVEVSLSEQGEINLNSSFNDMQKIKDLAKEIGIELYSLASGLYWQYPFTDNDFKTREKARNIAQKQLEIASWLGCRTILIIPGVVHADFIPDCEIVDYDIAYERALSAIVKLKAYAEEFKIFIGIENVWNKFLLSPLEMRDFIDKAGGNFVKSYFDIGNAALNGFPEHWIKILGPRICNVHIKDYRHDAGFVKLLDGEINFPVVMEELRKIGYDGWVTAEVDGYRHYPDLTAVNTSNSLRRILNV